MGVLAELLVKERILDLAGADKRSVLEELVDAVAAVPGQLGKKALMQAILDREELRSTGIGEAIAIPHCKAPGIKSFGLALGRTRVPIEFGSPDGAPVRVLALISAPSNRQTEYLRLLSTVTRFLKQERERILKADPITSIAEAMATY